MKKCIKTLPLFFAILLVGCGPTRRNEPQQKSPKEQISQKKTASSQKQKENQLQKELARRTTDALFARLSARLMSVISADGPAKAISVCSEEAPMIAQDVGGEFGVSIGRTSFKLRNSKNVPPEWAASFVESRIDKPQYVDLPDGKFGALLPIVLQPKCVTCHGPRDTIAEDVRTALNERYPDDQATGFQAGDLRGWFWVEVPARPEE